MKRGRADKNVADDGINFVEELSREYELEQFFQKLYQQRWKIVALISLCAILLVGGSYYQRATIKENEKNTLVFFEQLELFSSKATTQEKEMHASLVPKSLSGVFSLTTGAEVADRRLVADSLAKSLLEYRHQLKSPNQESHGLITDSNIANLSRELQALELLETSPEEAYAKFNQLLNSDISQNQRQRIELWITYLLNHGIHQSEDETKTIAKE